MSQRKGEFHRSDFLRKIMLFFPETPPGGIPLLHFWLCHFPGNSFQSFNKMISADVERADSQGVRGCPSPWGCPEKRVGSRGLGSYSTQRHTGQVSGSTPRGSQLSTPHSAHAASFLFKKKASAKKLKGNSWFLHLCLLSLPQSQMTDNQPV